MPNMCTGKGDICTFASTVLHSLVLLYSPDSAILRFILVIYIDTMSFLSCHSRGREKKERKEERARELLVSLLMDTFAQSVSTK